MAGVLVPLRPGASPCIPERCVRGSPPSDGSSETIFIPSYADFTRRLGAAKTLRIEANVYKQGAPVWEFDVSGFDPEQLK